MRRLVTSGLAVALLFSMSQLASAAFISGEIAFTATSFNTNTGNLGTATALDSIVSTVGASTGDFGSVAAGTSVTYNDFSFNPLPGGGVTPLWSVGGFTFNLETVSIDSQSSTQLALSGTGIVSGSGFSDTNAVWNLTANTFGSTFTFSSGTAAVPEASTVVTWSLMGLTGLGMLWIRRRK